MTTCPECDGVGSYTTEWGDVADDDRIRDDVLYYPDPPDGTVIMRCHVCGPLLLRVAALNKLVTEHEEVKTVVGRTCQRFEVMGLGQLAEEHFDTFELIESACIDMIAQLPHTKGYQ